MVYFPTRKSSRTPAQWRNRKIIGLAAVIIIVYLLSQIPYTLLREERARLFGEAQTAGIVIETSADMTTTGERRFLLRYKYIDSDGFVHEAVAPVERKAWATYRPESRIQVFYVHSRPDISRIKDEIEPPLQVWLRKVFG